MFAYRFAHARELMTVCAVASCVMVAATPAGHAAANVDIPKAALSDEPSQGVTATVPGSIRLPGVTPQERPPQPFGTTAASPEGPVWVKWRALAAELARDTAVLARCRKDMDTCPAEAQQLIAIIDVAHAKTGRARIGEVNRAVNLAIRPVTDMAQHGVADRWSAPLATFASGRGDCEDYAIAKYLALREAGVTEADLRLLIVHDQRVGDHAVLTVRQDERWLVLDNRHFNLVDAAESPNFVPLYAMGADGVQTFATARLSPSVPFVAH